MKKILIILSVMLLLAPLSYAKQGHLKLLAIREKDSSQIGSGADLYLEIIPGKGRVFLETFPLTKVDTQMSTRFAKEIACKYIDINCDNHDFIYTIRADSSIIGGPSAGAAISVLTIALLKDIKIDESISITGAINPGGLVGPIGGLKEKIIAGQEIGLKKILIPKGQRFYKEFNLSTNMSENTTLDLIKLGQENGIDVVEVSDLGSAVYEFAGIRIDNISENVTIDSSYSETMKGLALDLCERSKDMKDQVIDNSLNLTEINDLLLKARDSFYREEYYSSASYCFSVNTKLRLILLKKSNPGKKDILDEVKKTKDEIKKFSEDIGKKSIQTITDLEAYMVVNERVLEAEGQLDKAILTINDTELSLSNLGFGIERHYSAIAWASFFDNRGKKFQFNNEILRNSCTNKLSEAEEMIQYANLYFPLTRSQSDLAKAFEYFNNENYVLCLFVASKAKAEADVLLGAMGVDEDMINQAIEQRLGAVKKNIVKQTMNNVFPILGYSYYEYAKTLKDSDPYSAMLFTAYSLELSNLDLYFKEKQRIYLTQSDYSYLSIFIAGLIAGLIIGIFMIRKKKPKKVINPGRTLGSALLGKKR